MGKFLSTVQRPAINLILERAYGALSSIALMYSWGYELEVDVIGMHKFFESYGAFIVKPLETWL
jgi:hypothetical protein